jgi:hypothetical protein
VKKDVIGLVVRDQRAPIPGGKEELSPIVHTGPAERVRRHDVVAAGGQQGGQGEGDILVGVEPGR